MNMGGFSFNELFSKNFSVSFNQLNIKLCLGGFSCKNSTEQLFQANSQPAKDNNIENFHIVIIYCSYMILIFGQYAQIGTKVGSYTLIK